MKICICTNTRPHEGGMTAYIDTIARGLRGRGHTADIVTPWGVSGRRRTWNRMVRFSDRVLRGREALTVGAYGIGEACLALILAALFHRRRWDVLFAVDDSAADVGHRLFGRTRVPVIHGVHSSLAGDLLNQEKIRPGAWAHRFFRNRQQRAYRLPDALIANSAYMASIIREAAPDHAPLHIAANPVDPALFYPTPAGCPNRDFTLFCPGRLVVRKGILATMEAFEILMRRRRDFRLVFVGDGPLKKELRRRIDAPDVRGRVFLAGPTPHGRMGDLYRAGDCVLAPSVTVHGLAEPQGLTALEAMACGVPVVASDMGGFREVVEHGVNGLLVPENDPAALALAVLNLRENPGLRRTLIHNGLETVRGFTPEAAAAGVEAVFHRRRAAKQARETP